MTPEQRAEKETFTCELPVQTVDLIRSLAHMAQEEGLLGDIEGILHRDAMARVLSRAVDTFAAAHGEL